MRAVPSTTLPTPATRSAMARLGSRSLALALTAAIFVAPVAAGCGSKGNHASSGGTADPATEEEGGFVGVVGDDDGSSSTSSGMFTSTAGTGARRPLPRQPWTELLRQHVRERQAHDTDRRRVRQRWQQPARSEQHPA